MAGSGSGSSSSSISIVLLKVSVPSNPTNISFPRFISTVSTPLLTSPLEKEKEEEENNKPISTRNLVEKHFSLISQELDQTIITSKIDESESNQILEAALAGNVGRVKKLIKDLNNVNGTKEEISHIKDSDGRGLLQAGAAKGRINVCKYLFEDLKLHVDEKDKGGCTALLHVSLEGNLSTVKYLTESGADPAALNEHNTTALRLAALEGNIEVIEEFLLSKGANANAPSDIGTPLQLAAQLGDSNVLHTQLDNGAEFHNPEPVHSLYSACPGQVEIILKDQYQYAHAGSATSVQPVRQSTNSSSDSRAPVENGHLEADPVENGEEGQHIPGQPQIVEEEDGAEDPRIPFHIIDSDLDAFTDYINLDNYDEYDMLVDYAQIMIYGHLGPEIPLISYDDHAGAERFLADCDWEEFDPVELYGAPSELF